MDRGQVRVRVMAFWGRVTTKTGERCMRISKWRKDKQHVSMRRREGSAASLVKQAHAGGDPFSL